MNIKVLSLLLGLVIALPIGASEATAQDPAPRGELVRLVMLSRHGVRPPLQTTDKLNEWRRSPKPDWPDFGVCPGYLTNPKGVNLIKLMGDYYRTYPDYQKLFPGGQCPKDDVFFWADVDERTRVTAEALVYGLNCRGVPIKGVPIPYKDPCACKEKDPSCYPSCCKAVEQPNALFHPTKAEKNLENCSLDPTKVEHCADLDKLKHDLIPQIAEAQGILQCCSPGLCKKAGLPQTCELQDLPSKIEPDPQTNPNPQHVSASVTGGLGIAQSFAEILLLEYAQFCGKDCGKDFGFGRATEAKMLDTLKIHTGVFDKVQRCQYVAQPQGDNLLYHIAYAVENGRDPSEKEGKEKKFIAYIGHDTNIANVAGLLNLHWKLSEYPEDDMPPGGALIFEVRQESDSQLYVYPFFAAQSPDTMRQGAKGAEMKAASIPCKGRSSCTMAEFINLTHSALDNEAKKVCVTDER